MTDRGRVLLATNYHHRHPFYEATVKTLSSQGYERWLILNTNDSERHHYKGPTGKHIRVEGKTHQNTEGGLRILRQMILEPKYRDVDTVIFLDDDSCMSGSTELTSLIECFTEDGYDHAGIFRSVLWNALVRWDSRPLVQYESIELHTCNRTPDSWVEPFCSASYMLWSREALKKYEIGTWAYSTWKAHNDGIKKGAAFSRHLWDITFITDEFCHIGNTSMFWYMFSHKIAWNTNNFLSLRSGHPEHAFKLGYFIASQKYYGSLGIEPEMEFYHNHYTPREKCIEVWNETIKTIPALSNYPI